MNGLSAKTNRQLAGPMLQSVASFTPRTWRTR